ncbi:hypothetical protein ACNFR7_16370 [Streptomyces sp. RM1]|uniref:hypothetical protein n=1 Tax=Streptomyces misionensis TaxID=67331 RepID=UPI003BAF49BD
MASTGGGSKPGQQEKLTERRSRRDRAVRARQRPRQPPEKKRLHQPNTRFFSDEEFDLIKSAPPPGAACPSPDSSPVPRSPPPVFSTAPAPRSPTNAK